MRRPQSKPTTTTPRAKRQPRATPLDDLREAIRLLPDAERLELIDSLGFKAAREVIVMIFDGQQHPGDHNGTLVSDKERPRAIVIFGPRGNVQRQEIDILASVRADARNIGHPAILFAIRFWQASIISRSKLRIDRGDGRGEGTWLTECGQIAKTHLCNLGKAIFQGVQGNAWPAARAFEFYRPLISKRIDFYLELVFEAYQKSESRNASKLIETVRARLLKDEVYEDGSLRTALPPESLKTFDIGFDVVREFLTSSKGKDALNGRRQWSRWKNLYDEWELGREDRALRKRSPGRRPKSGSQRPSNESPALNSIVGIWPDSNRDTVSTTIDALTLRVVPIENR